MIEVARRYKFHATHHIPGAPEPWCEPHEHDYTVEVVAAGEPDRRLGFVIDTDLLDATWDGLREYFEDQDLNRSLPVQTSVEVLAQHILNHYWVEPVVRVTVWEDESRWGRATR